MKNRKLGRGLDILLDKSKTSRRGTDDLEDGAASRPSAGEGSAGGDPARPDAPESSGQPGPPADEPGDSAPRDGGIVSLDIAAIQPNPDQPRATFSRSELEALKASVSRDGILQPVLVRETATGFELVAGERRLRAAQELGHTSVPGLVIEVDDQRMLELALVENIHRENLNPIDTARAFQGLIELKGWTQDELARHLGLGRPTVSNTLRLLDLPSTIQGALRKGQIQMGHAKILLSVPSATEQQKLFERIAEDRLSVRELELAREPRPGPPPGAGGASGAPRASGSRRGKAKPRGNKSADTVQLETELSEALGTRVSIRERDGRGTVTIEFYSAEEFEHLRLLLAGGGQA